MPSSNTHRRHVTVVGSGIVGISCAWQLQENGFQVTLIDRREPGEACSYGNAGVIATSSCVPQVLPGTWRSVPGWLLDKDGPLAIDLRDLPRLAGWFVQAQRSATAESVRAAGKALSELHGRALSDHLSQARTADCVHLLRRTEYLHVYTSAASHAADHSAWKLRRELGISMREVDRKELREIEPALADRFARGVLLDGHGAVLDPGGLVKALARDFVARDGRYLQADVRGVRPIGERGVALDLEDGRLETGTLVLAAGAWSARLAHTLGHDFPLAAERGYHVMFADPGIELSRPVMFAEAKFVANSMTAGLRVAGTAEFAAIDRPMKPRRIAMLERLIAHYLPGLNRNWPTPWMGARPSLPDTLPVIGRSHIHPDVILAFGHGHTGLTASATTGRIVAALVGGEEPPIDIRAFRSDRFPTTVAGNTVARSPVRGAEPGAID